jgi:type VI secretion system protein ImpH
MAAESRLEGPDLTDHDADVVIVDLDAAVAAVPTSEAESRAGVRLPEVERLLREQPHSFGFFQAVRLLERLQPNRSRVGGFDDPDREVVRFGVPPHLAFPASEIQQLELNDDAPSMMRVNFFGLTGAQGVLPHVFTLLAQDRLRSRDAALVDFLDIFHHRLLSLFYQAWRKYRFTVAREDASDDHLSDHLLDLIGLGLTAARDRQDVADEALVYRAGLLAPQPRGAASLQQLLEDYFRVPVEVEQFVGGWHGLDVRDRCAVGAAEDAGNVLGGAVVGDEIWDAQARVRIRLGPLERNQFDAFLPGGAAHRELTALLRFFSHDQFEFDAQLVLAADDVPGIRFDDADTSAPPRLGWSTWIRNAPRMRDADETVLTLDRKAAS